MKHLKMLSPAILVIVLLSFILSFTNGTIFDDLFNPGLDKSPQFPNSQLYLLDDTSNSVGLDGINGYIGCFGDFNSDKYTDLFVIVGNNTDTRVDVFLWNRENWQFVNSTATVAEPYITNIAAGDFNYDGKLDLMVSGLNVTTNKTYVKIFVGDHQTFVSQIGDTIQNAFSQVSVLDANNDLHLDLFGEIEVIENDTTTVRRVFWINSGDGTFYPPIFDANGAAPLFPNHGSVFVDINGDCLADRFVLSQDEDGNPQYEILINNKAKGYAYPTNTTAVRMPLGSGQVSFADFDKDGNIDFIIPVCHPRPSCSEVNSIYIHFNKQKPLCSLLSKSSTCRSSTAMCTADQGFRFGVYNTSDPYFQEVVLPTDSRFYFDESNGRPLRIRSGDYNLDGYPDILIPLVNKEGFVHVELWQNTAGQSRRSFEKVNNGVDALTEIRDAYAAAFFDLDEDGVLDMFVLADNPPRIETLFNNFDIDAFFLKTLGLNGVCNQWCPGSPQFPSPKPYGVNFAGAVFKFQYTDLSGKAQLATGTQLTQSSYLALETPYTLFGLGRTSNYIEQFFFGVPLNTTHFNYWTGSTIPNSQVVAVPYKPDSPSGWTLELYITPSGLMFWIMVALVGSLIILAIIVYVFYRKEKKEDEQKKQEQAHLFSFDAL